MHQLSENKVLKSGYVTTDKWMWEVNDDKRASCWKGTACILPPMPASWQRRPCHAPKPHAPVKRLKTQVWKKWNKLGEEYLQRCSSLTLIWITNKIFKELFTPWKCFYNTKGYIALKHTIANRNTWRWARKGQVWYKKRVYWCLII